MREYMRAVLRDVRGVHDHHVFTVADAVDDHVVDDRAVLVGEQAVPRLARREACDVARDEAIEVRPGTATLEEELAHVREIEETGVSAHRTMFGDDALVLDRHLVARERHHLRAELGVLVEEWRAPHGRRLGRHYAASSAAASARSRMSR